MNMMTSKKLKKSFAAIQQIIPDSSVEFWCARKPMTEQRYDQRENFSNISQKASETCDFGGVCVEDHSRNLTKKTGIKSRTEQFVEKRNNCRKFGGYCYTHQANRRGSMTQKRYDFVKKGDSLKQLIAHLS